MSSPDEEPIEFWLRAALDLDQDERAYLAGLDLAGTWRRRPLPTTAMDARGGWLALIAVVTAFITWSLAGPSVADVLAVANVVGLTTFVVTNLIEILVGLIQTFVEFAATPSLGLSQPLLALLALVLLFWPRITSATHFLQGARS